MKPPIKNFMGWNLNCFDTDLKACSVLPAVGSVGCVVYNKTDLCCTIQCLFANRQLLCSARLHFISSVSTITFTIIPQMSTQKSIQLLPRKAGPIRNGFDANVTALIHEKSATSRLISHLSFSQKPIFDTMLMSEGRELTLYCPLHLSPASTSMASPNHNE